MGGGSCDSSCSADSRCAIWTRAGIDRMTRSARTERRSVSAKVTDRSGARSREHSCGRTTRADARTGSGRPIFAAGSPPRRGRGTCLDPPPERPGAGTDAPPRNPRACRADHRGEPVSLAEHVLPRRRGRDRRGARELVARHLCLRERTGAGPARRSAPNHRRDSDSRPTGGRLVVSRAGSVGLRRRRLVEKPPHHSRPTAPPPPQGVIVPTSPTNGLDAQPGIPVGRASAAASRYKPSCENVRS